MSFVHVETLQGLRLPEASPYRRDHVMPPEQRTDAYLARYDDRTLIYDAVRLPDGRILVTAPAAFNLWPLLRNGLRLNGRRPRRVRSWRRLQTEQLTLPKGETLAVEIDGKAHPVPIRESVASRFAGLNALVVVNKDNRLDWIRDWLRHYIQAHGLQALVVFDNLSQTYAPAELAECAAAAGLQAIAVYSAPFPYGPPVKLGVGQRDARLLQVSMLNLARRDVLSKARAVLNVDVDEVIPASQGPSIFDRAAARWFGFVKVHGSWVFPRAGATLPAPHSAHTQRSDPDRRCNQKWSARPDAFLSRIGWSVHRVGDQFSALVHAEKDLRLYHCKGTSTGWKRSRFHFPDTLVTDPTLEGMFAEWPK